MRKIFSLALLCLIFCNAAMAQQPNKDSLDYSKNYIIQDSVLIQTRDGAHISAMIVRKKNVIAQQAAILVFTIYARVTDIKKGIEAADKGYVGVLAYTRGKRYSPDVVIPYEHDGEDVYDVIDWITKQTWSNNKVAMYGGSYNGFTQWASTKHLHPALKTIVPSASVAPGLDAPMMNNVLMTFPFSWTYYVSNNKFLDTADYNNNQQWNGLYQKWFDEGRSYRSMDTLAGRPGNTAFHHWVNHPTYDKYWQHMIPYKEDFSKINIPVLTTTGYYDDGQVGAMYYFREHNKYNPKAEHYLIIGPYGHFGSQGYPDSVFEGYRIDSVANISIHNIIYQWFDHILKGGPLPAVLKDNINYEVMGSNKWKHAASLNGMSNDTLTFYMSNIGDSTHYKLGNTKPAKAAFVAQQMDFADRTTRNSYYWVGNIIYDSLFTDALVFTSEPLKEPVEFSGRFSGELKASINKKDMDYSVVLFEQMPNGKYFYLTYFMGRASYVRDNTKRRLLIPGSKTALPFTNTYITSRLLSKGSRIVAIVGINKSPFEQINYGTGKDVNDETIKDAKAPLQIKWFTDSFIKIPVWK